MPTRPGPCQRWGPAMRDYMVKSCSPIADAAAELPWVEAGIMRELMALPVRLGAG